MFFTAVFVLLGTGLTVNCKNHSLIHIYIAFSKNVDLPGIHKFTATGFLDGRRIYYDDSETQKKVHKQDWIKEQTYRKYWLTGIRSRLNNVLLVSMEQMGQSDSDIHVLQWMHGCEGEVQSNSSLKFVRGMYKYGYDGNDLLSFDIENQDWVGYLNVSCQIKKKWHADPSVTMDYLKNECMKWLSKFMEYGKEQLPAELEVFLFAQKSKVEGNTVLTCLATGFCPIDIILRIRRNGRVLTKEDGLHTTGVRPNEDDTFQRKDHVEILKSDKADYTCEVIHAASNLHDSKKWNKILPDDGKMGVKDKIIIGAVVVGLLLFGSVTVVIIRRRYLQEQEEAGTPSEVISPGSDSLLSQESGARRNNPTTWWCTKDNGVDIKLSF